MSNDEKALSSDVELIKYEVEGVRGRLALLGVSLPEEVDEEFQDLLEEDIAYLLSLIDNVLKNNPEALRYNYRSGE